MPYDPRAIANLALKYAWQHGAKLTNFSVNKVIFFLHGHYLARTGRPLVDESFEAWQHGPVISSIYSCFKIYGNQPIQELAKRIDFATGEKVEVWDDISEQDLAVLAPYLNIYTRADASQLYDWSHVDGGPWDRTWNYKSLSNPGMVISEQSIANHFRHEATLHGGFRA